MVSVRRTRAISLWLVPYKGKEHPLKRIIIDPTLVASKKLYDFVTGSTCRFFSITGQPPDVLHKGMALWSTDESYQSAQAIVRSVRVVDIIAELLLL